MAGSNFGPECIDLRCMDSNINKTKTVLENRNCLVDDTYEYPCHKNYGTSPHNIFSARHEIQIVY